MGSEIHRRRGDWRGGFTEIREGDSQKVGREIPRKWGRRFPESGEGDSQKAKSGIYDEFLEFLQYPQTTRNWLDRRFIN